MTAFITKISGRVWPTRDDPDAIFDTEYLKWNLGNRAASGGLVVFASQLAKFILQTGSQMALARLLVPADFGLIAMVVVFSGFMHLFQDMGLTMATVQRTDISHRQVSVLFWINLGVSFILASLFAGLSPVMALFYGEPRVLGVALALSTTFLLAGLTAQHLAIMRRHMRFRAIAAIDIGSMACAIGLAIFLAVSGFGYWALIALMVGQGVVQMVLVWLASPWRPSLIFKTEEMGGLLKFGGNLTAFNIVNYGTRNADNLMLGAAWGPAVLGLYSKAYGMLLLPLKQINSPISSVAIPSLSRLQEEPERFASFYCKMLQVAAYLSMPVVMLFIILSEEAVLVLLGKQWLEAVPIFRMLSILAFGQTAQNSTGWVLISLGRTNRMFKWSLIQGPCAILAFAIGLRWGGFGVATAATICGMTLLIPNLLYVYHGTPVKISMVGKVLLRPLLFTGIILATAGPVRYLVSDQSLVIRIVATLMAAAAASGLALLLWKSLREDYMSIKHVIKKKKA